MIAMLPMCGLIALASPVRANEADVLVDRVQKFYDQISDYSADFIQLYTRVALSRTVESKGKLSLQKPGKMRWEYATPAKKLWVADGQQLFIYDVEEQQVFVDSAFETAKLSRSIRFLWGEGRLRDTFAVALADTKALRLSDGSSALELTPKDDATYAKLVLVVDTKTGHVSESILYETSGNTNHFKFRDVKLNTKLPADLFRFTPPKDVEVIHR